MYIFSHFLNFLHQNLAKACKNTGFAVCSNQMLVLINNRGVRKTQNLWRHLWMIPYLVLNVNGDIFLLPENSTDKNRDCTVQPHQVHHRGLHEGQVGQGCWRQQEGLGWSSLFGEIWNKKDRLRQDRLRPVFRLLQDVAASLISYNYPQRAKRVKVDIVPTQHWKLHYCKLTSYRMAK